MKILLVEDDPKVSAFLEVGLRGRLSSSIGPVMERKPSSSPAPKRMT